MRHQEGIAKHGIRNAVLLTIAPTGTTSLVSGVSSGVEPVYEFSFLRKWRGGEEIVYHPLFDSWKAAHPDVTVRPEYFASANDLTPLEHTRVQAIAQEYIDSSISKTVNAPNSHTVEDVKALYMMAYDMGLKGVTYMRDGSRVGVLSRVEEKKEEIKPDATVQLSTLSVMPRPNMVEGVTYFADTPTGKSYVTINHNENKEPFEVFITNGKSGSDVMAMADALGRMISLVLRLNSPIPAKERMSKIVSQLSGISGARSVGFGNNRVRSLPDAIAKVLSNYGEVRANGQTPAGGNTNEHTTNGISNGHANGHANGKLEDVSLVDQLAQQLPLTASQGPTTNLFDLCPECGSGTLAFEEGCKKCYSCGYSEC